MSYYTTPTTVNSNTSFDLTWIATNPGEMGNTNYAYLYLNDNNITTSYTNNDGTSVIFNVTGGVPQGSYTVRVDVPDAPDQPYDQTASTPLTIQCFVKGTEILIKQKEPLELEYYECVENLQIGDLVKTINHTYMPIKHILKKTFVNDNIIHQIHKISNLPNQTKDMWITGGHSLLVNELTEEQREKTLKYWSQPQKIGDKFLLLTCCNEHAEKINDNETYELFHLVLENNGEMKQAFGIYANGIETETMSEQAYLENYCTLNIV